MNEWKDIEIEGIDETLSGYSDDGTSFIIVANISSFPPEEWRESFLSRWQCICQENASLHQFSEPEILWSSNAGCSIKAVSPHGGDSVKQCIRLIHAMIMHANDVYRPLAEKREHHQINRLKYIAKLNEWIAVQNEAGWPLSW